MVTYQEIKTELKKQGTTAARYFTCETLKTYINDRRTAKKRIDTGADNSEAWNGAGIYDTAFYRQNGGGYCVFLEIMAGYAL
nr:MAG TPA: hypothetical protein [Caudoviricetes sp.]